MGASQFAVFAALAMPFLAAAVAPFVARHFANASGWILAAAPFFSFLQFSSLLDDIAVDGRVTGGYQWVPSFGVSFSWYLDGLSLTFGLLISGIGLLIVIYSGGYLKGHAHLGRFYSFILLFMGSMLGLVAADSFLMLFVFWELTSITSFLLIGFDHSSGRSRRAALQALVVTGAGGLALLAGLLIAGNIANADTLSLLLASGDALRESPFYLAAFLLILGAAFTKSAQFPFHFWLPNAMEAPTPVSAYLHSATMVKAGVYLLMRMNPVMGGTPIWETVLPLFGAATMLTGAVLSIRQRDLKMILAYTTVASLGLLVMLTGYGSAKAIEAAVLYLIAHAFFKGALFMVAGAVDHEAGTRDIVQLGGLRRAMPLTFAAALLAALSMSGLPPFLGFLAKEEIYAALAGGDLRALALLVAAVAGNALMVAAALAVALLPFLGEPRPTPRNAHEAPLALWLGPALLALKGLASAILAAQLHATISTPMASAVAGVPVGVTITPVPHLGAAFYLSLGTIAAGLITFARLDRVRGAVDSAFRAIGWGPDKGFDQAMRGLVRVAIAVTRFIQPGRMDIYMTVTMLLIAAACLVPMVLFGELPDPPAMSELHSYEWTAIILAVTGLMAVVHANNRLTAIVSLGIQGFAVALLFMLFGAPDLSFTQFMVETLSVVILALVMTRLHLAPQDHRPLAQKISDMTVAILCGAGLGLALLKITQLPFDTVLTAYFNQYSLAIAHGRNVVNVIIVDFRGFDTLGEIAVVMITGLAILALIRIRGPQATREADTRGRGQR
jgi:multicomponent Na+:H+ antiporter subunit A